MSQAEPIPPPIPPPLIKQPVRASQRRPPQAGMQWSVVLVGGLAFACGILVTIAVAWLMRAAPAEVRKPRLPIATARPLTRSPSGREVAPPEVPRPATASVEPVAEVSFPPAADSSPVAPLAAAASAVEPETPLPAAPETPAPTPSKTTLFQEVDIRRSPRFTILGSAIAQDLQYKIVSELTVGPADDTGTFTVDQVVREAQLLKADDLSRSLFEQSLAELKGWQFRYQLNGRREIVAWRSSPPTGKRAAPVKPAGTEGFLVTSVMDEDGWKELAQWSFIVPDLQSRDESWSRSLSHNFEPLGSWYGETRFTPQATEQGVLRIDFVHEMVYTPPAKAKAGLPFAIKKATFRPEAAKGTIHYDTRARRVQRAEEHFYVKGALTTEVLGQEAAVEVEEEQTIVVRLTDRKPGEAKP